MNKKKCPHCGSAQTKRNGLRTGVQLYKCKACGRQFRAGAHITQDDLWEAYTNGKQTIYELASIYRKSPSSIKRRLRDIERVWVQPNLSGQSGYVHLDATYWGHNWGVMLALDDATNKPLYMAFIKSETTLDYRLAVDTIVTAGYTIRGIIIDGKQALFKEFEMYPIQMCQFHMKQIITRNLTKNPRMHASRELKAIMDTITYSERDDFVARFNQWKIEWDKFINRRTISKVTGKTLYTHRRLRSAMISIDYYLPYLFTYQRAQCNGMPNTNNKIEGTFTDLKKNLNNHSGMSIRNRVRFINGYFSDRL